MPDRLSVRRRFLSDPKGFRELRGWIAGVVAEAGLAAREREALTVAVSEMCANVYRHAYAGRRDGPIDLAVDAGPERAVVTLGHEGAPFDPGGYVPPDLTQPAEGGYGVYIASQLLDEIRFERTASGGTIVLVRERMEAGVAEPADKGGR